MSDGFHLSWRLTGLVLLLIGCSSSPGVHSESAAAGTLPTIAAGSGGTSPSPPAGSSVVPQTPTTDQAAPATSPTIGSSAPSIDYAQAAQLIAQMPELTGDSSSKRANTDSVGALTDQLRAIATKNAAGDDSFFVGLGQQAKAGVVVDAYLMCTETLGDSCGATVDDFSQWAASCADPQEQWAGAIVGDDTSWAAAGVCLWLPTTAERSTAADVVNGMLAEASAPTPPTRSAKLDEAAGLAATRMALGVSSADAMTALAGTYPVTGMIPFRFVANRELSRSDAGVEFLGAELATLTTAPTAVGYSTFIRSGSLVVVVVLGS